MIAVSNGLRVGAADAIATLPRSSSLRTIKHAPLVLLDLPYDPIRVNIETHGINGRNEMWERKS